MYVQLLKDWCDQLLQLQITEKSRTELYGGILCPACARVHGRCGDAIYPMMFLAGHTGEQKYLDGAKRLFLWSERMVCPDHAYYNDTNSQWKGITVFAVIQLAEALYYHGQLLDDDTRQSWMERLGHSADYLFHNIDQLGGNINYPITCSHAMAIAGRVLKRDCYREKARELAHRALHYFTLDGLLFGEGKPKDLVTEKGCRPVDLGYNVEESLPALVAYAKLEQDDLVMAQVLKSMKSHLAFMLPDGAWDNSWGTRNSKWSYWGSRTADGCQSGFAIASEQDPEFGQAVYRNTELLKACTHQGLLYGGPMYYDAGIPPCVHHTFCHAKSLAAMLEHQYHPMENPEMQLPREKEGVQYFPSVHVHLLAKGAWRATVSDYDFEYCEEGHATGGALTMLWHKQFGVISTASMGRYQMIEPNNMQLPPNVDNICLTPRIELEKDGALFRNINDKKAVVQQGENHDLYWIKAEGNLADSSQQTTAPFLMEYQFTAGTFSLRASADAQNCRFIFPLVSKKEWISVAGSRKIIIRKGEEQLFLEANLPFQCSARIFNPVGGFEALPVTFQLQPGQTLQLTITTGKK